VVRDVQTVVSRSDYARSPSIRGKTGEDGLGVSLCRNQEKASRLTSSKVSSSDPPRVEKYLTLREAMV